MARLHLDEVLASIFDSDDDSDDFDHLDSESKEEEDKRVSAYTCQQQFSLEKLTALSQVVSTEPLASNSSRRLCVAWRNKKTLLVNEEL